VPVPDLFDSSVLGECWIFARRARQIIDPVATIFLREQPAAERLVHLLHVQILLPTHPFAQYHVLYLFSIRGVALGWNDFSLPACGECYDNEDGSSRQEELARCTPGEMVYLIREPDNPHDQMAVAIHSERGVRLGYLSRDRARWIGSKIDRGYDVRAIVERVKGAHLRDAALGLVIRVSMDPERADEPELPDVSERRVIAAGCGIELRTLSRIETRADF
jgi:hypothetical protein